MNLSRLLIPVKAVPIFMKRGYMIINKKLISFVVLCASTQILFCADMTPPRRPQNCVPPNAKVGHARAKAYNKSEYARQEEYSLLADLWKRSQELSIAGLAHEYMKIVQAFVDGLKGYNAQYAPLTPVHFLQTYSPLEIESGEELMETDSD